MSPPQPVVVGALRRLRAPPLVTHTVRVRDYGEAVIDCGPNAGRLVRKSVRVERLHA